MGAACVQRSATPVKVLWGTDPGSVRLHPSSPVTLHSSDRSHNPASVLCSHFQRSTRQVEATLSFRSSSTILVRRGARTFPVCRSNLIESNLTKKKKDCYDFAPVVLIAGASSFSIHTFYPACKKNKVIRNDTSIKICRKRNDWKAAVTASRLESSWAMMSQLLDDQ